MLETINERIFIIVTTNLAFGDILDEHAALNARMILVLRRLTRMRHPELTRKIHQA
jgi:hypothetical protein